MDRRALGLWGIISTLSVSCALFAPIDEIRESAPKMDAPSVRVDAGGTVMPRERVDGKADAAQADGGTPEPPEQRCTSAPGAECSPLRACSCHSGLECRLDELALRVRCQTPGSGRKQSGQPCADTAECASGLACTRDHVCSPYCERDEDCTNGKCVAHTDRATGKQVAGASACSRWCDPISGETCQTGTSCYVTGQDDPDPHAACRALQDMHSKARGEPCQVYNGCEAGLSCAEFGPRVCTNFCIFDSDCPRQMPHCYTDFLMPQVAAPGKRAGQCVVWPCEDSTVPSPQPWNEGPVWTAEQLVTCGNTCGPSRDCYRQRCTGGEIWGRCMDTALRFCGGAKGAACRREYVDLSCSDVRARQLPEQRFQDCLERQTACFSQAEQVCAAMR